MSRPDPAPDAPPDAAAVHAALDEVCDPCSLAAGAPLSLRDMGLVRSVRVEEGTVRVALGVTGPGCTFAGHLLDAAARAVRAVPGVVEVDVHLDTDFVWEPSALSPAAATALDGSRRRTLALTAVRPRQWEEQTRP